MVYNREMPITTDAALENFRKWVMQSSENECHIYRGASYGLGYGSVAINGKNWLAHRLAYSLVNGGIPPKAHVLHSCDVPACCNPNHLRTGTQKDNMGDKSARGRHHNQRKQSCPRGHPYDNENTRWYDGRRKCAKCLRAQSLKSYHKCYVKIGYRLGENNHFHKLNAEDVVKIRSEASSGIPVKRIADCFGIQINQVYRILRKECWSHI